MRLRLPIIALAALLSASCDSPAEPLRPSTMTAHTSLEQDAVVASATAVPPAVRITTASGEGVPGVEVTFAAQSGSTIATALVRTDNQGVATPGAWTMSTTAGVQELVATTTSLPDQQVRFRANAVAAAPQRLLMTTPIAAMIASGATLSPAPAVQLQSTSINNARVPGVVITAAVDRRRRHAAKPERHDGRPGYSDVHGSCRYRSAGHVFAAVHCGLTHHGVCERDRSRIESCRLSAPHPRFRLRAWRDRALHARRIRAALRSLQHREQCGSAVHAAVREHAAVWPYYGSSVFPDAGARATLPQQIVVRARPSCRVQQGVRAAST